FWQAKNSEALQENIIKVAKDDQDGVTATFDGQPLVWGAYDISAERSKTDVIRHIENLISETDKERINIKAFISDSAEEYAAARHVGNVSLGNIGINSLGCIRDVSVRHMLVLLIFATPKYR
ncbi:hypothetical protein RhiirC2_798665, partial [Rhizophagus irregularis]